MLELRLTKEFRNASSPFRLDVDYAFKATHKSAVLFGSSGSGKTLTLQCIAGLVRPDAGHIRVCGCTLFDSEARLAVPVQQRRIGYMFQEYALFPHLTLLQNVAYPRTGCLARLIHRQERERAQTMLERFGIGHLARHFPAQISGGQRQRAALARACNADPQLLLLDEPFSALDPLLRERLRQELRALLLQLAVPVVVITHDPEDVDVFAGGLALYNDGRACLVPDYAAVRADFATAGACLRHLQENAHGNTDA